MKKSEKAWCAAGIIFLMLSIAIIICELFSVSVFIFGKRLIYIIGVFLIISAVSFTAFAFSVFKNHKQHFKNKKIITLGKILVIIACLFIFAAGLLIDGLLYTKTIYKNVSPDKRHVIIVEGLEGSYEWNVTVYKRNTPMFLISRDSETINDMADDDEKISVEWVDGGCKMSYEIYTDDAQTADDKETVVQSFFFKEKQLIN